MLKISLVALALSFSIPALRADGPESKKEVVRNYNQEVIEAYEKLQSEGTNEEVKKAVDNLKQSGLVTKSETQNILISSQGGFAGFKYTYLVGTSYVSPRVNARSVTLFAIYTVATYEKATFKKLVPWDVVKTLVSEKKED